MFRFTLLLTASIVVAGLHGGREPAASFDGQAASTEVVIVGAGLAGLVTAYELRKQGIRTHLLEAEPMAGGRVATADYGEGLTAEFGLQEIWSNNPLVGIADELGVELEMGYEHCAHSTFMHEGRIYPDLYDGTMRGHWDSFLEPGQRQALEAWLADAQALHRKATSLGPAHPEVRALQDLSYRQWIESGNGLSEMARAWLRLHVEVELGSEWDRFSALFALLEMDIFFDGGAACYAVAGGNSRLVEALEEASGPLTPSARVTGIHRVDDYRSVPRLRVRYLKDRRVEIIDAARVVLAIPFYKVHQIAIDPPLSDAHWQALGTLQTGHYAPVHLVMNREGTTITTGDGVVVPDVILTSGSLGFVYGVVAENDTDAVFSLLPYGEHARAFHMSPRAANVERLLTELDRIQPGFSRHVREAHVYTYHPAAIPVWGPGRSPLDLWSALLREPVNGLYFAGDYLYGAHSNSAALSGIRVARSIAGELLEAERVATLGPHGVPYAGGPGCRMQPKRC